MDISALRSTLSSIGQDQTLRFWGLIAPQGRERLGGQLATLDPKLVSELAEQYVRNKPPVAIPRDIQPVKAYPRHANTPELKGLYAKAKARGSELLKAGKVGAFLVAGGQGTRLGYDGPKGEFPLTPIRHKPLFQVFAEQLLAWSRDSTRPIAWYVMTSEQNDAATRAFFQKHHHFGFDPKNVFFFQQGMMPAFATDGRLLLGEKDSLALSPDGHGGSLRALHHSGALADMRKRGIEHLSYFQVDNPLVHAMDPLFLGLHDLTGSEMSSKTIPKAHALERVGNFVIGDGVLQVIEYSDLPEELAKQTNPNGTLRFNAGSIAIHALRVSLVERLNSGGQLRLPWHRAEKKVPYVDEKGTIVKPEKPNAVKLEQFVFDAIALAKNAIVYTTDRAEEFSPVKNAQGDDSPATSRRDQVRRAAEWLEHAGCDVPRKNSEPDCVLEISPLFAVSAEQLKTRSLPANLPSGSPAYFGAKGLEK
jgi:UDP-N-acetylglucosamine/UDP-N-acetylgalactosamine diphosphorylase